MSRSIPFYMYISRYISPYPTAFTRYCGYQYCMVYCIHTGGRKGSPVLSNSRATVLQSTDSNSSSRTARTAIYGCSTGTPHQISPPPPVLGLGYIALFTRFEACSYYILLCQILTPRLGLHTIL